MPFIAPFPNDVSENEEFVVQSRLCTLTFLYVSDLQNADCCENEKTDGCSVLLENIPIGKVCNACLYGYFGEVMKMIQSPKAKYGKNFIVSFCGGSSFVISYASLFVLNKKMTVYFQELFNRHTCDEMFYSSDPNQMKFLENTKKLYGISDREYQIEKRASKGERKRFYNARRILSDLPEPNSPNVEIVRRHEQMHRRLKFDLYVYSVVNDIPCKAASHHRREKMPSVLVLTDKMDNGFTFSFCSEHLEQFARVLMKFVSSPNLRKYSSGGFSIEKGHFDSCCYLTEETFQYMFKLKIGNRYVILCRDALMQTAEKVLTSSVYSELFPVESDIAKRKICEEKAIS